MVHCVNFKHKEIEELSNQFNLDPKVTAAITAVWQERTNNMDRFPTADEFSKELQPQVKEGVNSVFKSNSELANIGTQQQYSQYLDTIFPDSKVKDIVYHGTKSADKILQGGFKKGFEGTANKGVEGFHFAPDIQDAIYFGTKEGEVLSAKIQSLNPKENKTQLKEENGDSILDVDEYLVFEPEQVHILGSKQDIEGFREFVKDKPQEIDTKVNISEPKIDVEIGPDSSVSTIIYEGEVIGEIHYVSGKEPKYKNITIDQEYIDSRTKDYNRRRSLLLKQAGLSKGEQGIFYEREKISDLSKQEQIDYINNFFDFKINDLVKKKGETLKSKSDKSIIGSLQGSLGGPAIFIEEEYRGKGLGKASYIALAKKLALEDNTLKSELYGEDNISEQALNIWKSLVRNGLAKKTSSGYEFINKVLLKELTQSDQIDTEAYRNIEVSKKFTETINEFTKEFGENYWKDAYLNRHLNNYYEFRDITIPTVKNKFEYDTKNVYHGTNSYQIDEGGNLILKPSENFRGKTNSVSFTAVPVVAQDYMLRKNGNIIIKINNNAIPSNYIFESHDEISVNQKEDIIIPKNSFQILEVDTVSSNKRQEYNHIIEGKKNKILSDMKTPEDVINTLVSALNMISYADQYGELKENLRYDYDAPKWYLSSEQLQGKTGQEVLKEIEKTYSVDELTKIYSDYIRNNIFRRGVYDKYSHPEVGNQVYGMGSLFGNPTGFELNEKLFNELLTEKEISELEREYTEFVKSLDVDYLDHIVSQRQNLGNPEAYRSIEVQDSNLEEYERQLGFKDVNGRRIHFKNAAARNKHLSNLPKELVQLISTNYKIKKRFARAGGPLTYKEIPILRLERIGKNVIIDNNYGEFDKTESAALVDNLFPNREATNTKDVLDKILESGELTDEVREIANLLKDVNLPVEFIRDDSTTLMTTDGTTVNVNLNQLENAHPRLITEGFIHELVHVKTVNALTNPQSEAEIFLSKRAKYLHNLFTKYDKENRYGGTNEIEFVAELLSNSEFRNYVKNLENRTIWQKFVNFLAEFFGVKKGSRKFISQLEELLSKEFKVQQFTPVNLEVESKTRKHLKDIIDSIGTRMKTMEYRKTKTTRLEVRPSKEEINKELESLSYGELAAKYDVNEATIIKWSNQERQKETIKTSKIYEKILEDLKQKYDDHKDLEGITIYMENLSTFMEDFDKVVKEKREDVENGSYANILKSAGTIRTLGTFATSNLHIIDQIAEDLDILKRENPESAEAIEDIEKVLGRANFKLKGLKRNYKDFYKIVVAKFLVPYGMGRSLEHIEEVISKPTTDIGWFSRWMDNMQESGDEALGMIDAALKSFFIEANQQSLKYRKDILKQKQELEKAGIKDTEFLVKKDSKGNNTHYFLTERDVVGYREAREAFARTLPEEGNNKRAWGKFFGKHGLNSIYNKEEYFKLIDAKKAELGDKFDVWIAANGIVNPNDGSTTIPFKEDKAYKELHKNKLKSDFYWNVLSEKYRLEKHLPARQKHLRRLPQMRKDFIERVKDGNWDRMLEMAGETFKRKKDDVEYGTDYKLTDEANNVIHFLPVYFTNKIPNVKDLSTDIVSSMIAYNFHNVRREKLNTIVDILELGKEAIRERGVYQTSGKGRLMKTIKTFTGDKTETTQLKASPGLVYERLNDYLEMFVYGIEKREGPTILGMDVEKLLDAIGKYTGLRVLAGNVYAGLANVNIGSVVSLMEAIEGTYYGKDDFAYSEKTFWGNVVGAMGDVGKRRPSYKLTLWSEYMDSMNEVEQTIYGVNADRRTKVGQMMTGSALYFTSRFPEFYLHNRVSLAVSSTYRFDKNTGRFVFKDKFFKELTELKNKKANKLKNLKLERDRKLKELGKNATQAEINRVREQYQVDSDKVSKEDYSKDIKKLEERLNSQWKQMTKYWDAWDAKDGELVLKDEFKNEFSEEDRKSFINRQHSVNNTIQGMYAKLDKAPVRKYALGRLGMMFRKWMIPAFNKRFIRRYDDFEKQMSVEGYYRIFGGFVSELYKDIRSGQYSLMKNWQSLTDSEKSAMMRVLQDAIMLTTISILGTILLNLKGDDDDDWGLNMLAYQANRLFSEYGALTPYLMLSEAHKIINAPLPATRTFQQLQSMYTSMNWFETVERGKYKDMLVIQRNLIRTIPLAETAYSLGYPEEKLKYFTSKNW